MKTKISEKGQITIPKVFRDELGLASGQPVEVQRDGGRLIITKVMSRDPLDEVYGTLDLGMTTDEFMEWLRGPRDDL